MAKPLVSPSGRGIRLDAYDLDIGVHGRIGALSTPTNMTGSLGKIGGVARTEAKRVGAQANGAKGGRPRKIARIA